MQLCASIVKIKFLLTHTNLERGVNRQSALLIGIGILLEQTRRFVADIS